MPVVYSNTVKDARMQAVITALGSGAVLVIGTSTLSGSTGVLATVTLANPAFTTSNGVMTMGGLPRTATASATGTAAKAELRTSGGVTIISGLTVGTSGTDVVINATAVSTGQTVQVTVGTITHG